MLFRFPRCPLPALALALVAVSCAAPPPPAPPPPPPAPSVRMVGGAVMDPKLAILPNLRKSADHRSFVAAVNGVGLTTTLESAGAYTVFAPGDAAFRALPAGTLDALLHPRSRIELGRVVGYHILPGARDAARIRADVQAGGGSAGYRTRSGEFIRARIEGGSVVLIDGNGRRGRVTQADVASANGIVHVVDTVLLPVQN